MHEPAVLVDVFAVHAFAVEPKALVDSDRARVVFEHVERDCVRAEEVVTLRVRDPVHAWAKIRRSEGPEEETIPLQNPAAFQHEVPTRSRCVKTFARPCRPSNRLGRAAQLGPDHAFKSTPRFPSYVIVYDPRFLDHVPSPLHVERPDRLRSIVERLEREGLFHGVETPPTAPIADLRRVHRGSYVELVRSLREGFLDPETAVHRDT